MTKLEAYKAHHYIFDPTYLSVSSHSMWGDIDWIAYIDQYGYWTVSVE